MGSKKCPLLAGFRCPLTMISKHNRIIATIFKAVFLSISNNLLAFVELTKDSFAAQRRHVWTFLAHHSYNSSVSLSRIDTPTLISFEPVYCMQRSRFGEVASDCRRDAACEILCLKSKYHRHSILFFCGNRSKCNHNSTRRCRCT